MLDPLDPIILLLDTEIHDRHSKLVSYGLLHALHKGGLALILYIKPLRLHMYSRHLPA